MHTVRLIGAAAAAVALAGCGQASATSPSAQPSAEQQEQVEPAAGDETPKSPSPDENEAQSKVSDRLLTMPGIAGIHNDWENEVMRAWFAGEAPQEAVDYAASNPHGITVEITDGAEFTREEAQAAAGNVIGDDELVEQAGIQSVAVNHDGSGFRVNMIADSPSNEVKQQIVEAAGIPAEHITYVENQGEMVNLPFEAEDAP
jgi:hypothetical protein